MDESKREIMCPNCASGYDIPVEVLPKSGVKKRKMRCCKCKTVFFAAIDAGENRELLQQAAILWDLQLYFEMHELLEPVWKDAEGAWRKALQGLIRAAGVKIHAEYNNRAAVSMSAKALKDLKRFGDMLKGFDKLDAVLAGLEEISPPSPGTCLEN